jgi:anti-sigma factor RsiW
MSEPWENKALSRTLWRRWTMSDEQAGAGTANPVRFDELTLAAYAEGRLDAADADEVEAFLRAHPELAEDVAAARHVASTDATADADSGLASVIARASALVPATDDRVIAFRPAPRRSESTWRFAARWGVLAASFAMVSYLGFALGTDASYSLATLGQSGTIALDDEVLDPPTGFLGGLGEISGSGT